VVGQDGVLIKMTDDSTLEPVNHSCGPWTTEATHPAIPGVVVHGTALVQWLEGERFLIHRAHTDHPDFPDGLSIIGTGPGPPTGGAKKPPNDWGGPHYRFEYRMQRRCTARTHSVSRQVPERDRDLR
jgi:hypothetical protein